MLEEDEVLTEMSSRGMEGQGKEFDVQMNRSVLRVQASGMGVSR